MKINNTRFLIFLSTFLLLLLFPFHPVSAKTIKTQHYNFSIGSGWNQEEVKIIETIAMNLDNIWEKVNEILENELPSQLELGITNEGLASTSFREEGKIVLNASHIKNLSIKDCLDRVAHETAHIALYKISKGKTMKWENKFLDEGIALYIGYLYIDEVEKLNALSQNIAQEDLKSGKASLNYLQNWERNVREKQREFIKNWRAENPRKTATLDDFIKGGYRTYFTSYSFVKSFDDKYGLPQLLNVLRSIGKGKSQAEAFLSISGQPLSVIVSEWHASLK